MNNEQPVAGFQFTLDGLSIVNSLNELTHDSLLQHDLLSKGTGAEKFLQKGPVNVLFKSKDDFDLLENEFNLRKQYGFDFNHFLEQKLRTARARRGPHLAYYINYTTFLIFLT